MSSHIYITTPLYYVNAKPHLGHAYTTLVADVIQRFNKMLGNESFFSTGTDEHGDKILKSATKQKKTPKKYADIISQHFKELWSELNISNDCFIRTTNKSHIKVVTEILKKLYKSGNIYFDSYEGLYCYDCERFYKKRELKNKKCPDHSTELHLIKESNYFFKMSKYQKWLIKYITENNDFIRPKHYKKEILALLNEPLEDLCISRPKSRITWGIDIPFDKNYVTYVWFDALINYLSVLNYPNGEKYKKFWPNTQHIIAKDILKPHAIYWPIMLKAANIPIFKHLNVHGYWKINKTKISKSLGNTINPLDIKNKYGLDQLRFFLMKNMVFGLDSTFNEKKLINGINSDLANDLGNLFSRVLSMVHKYNKGIIPNTNSILEEKTIWALDTKAQITLNEFKKSMKIFSINKAISALWKFISQMNKYIDIMSPWTLAKTKKEELNAVICNMLAGLRIISYLSYPIMPKSAQKMNHLIGLKSNEEYFYTNNSITWLRPTANTKLPTPIILFPKIEKNH